MLKQILLCLIITFISFFHPPILNAQSLVKGDIAFIGYNTDSPDGYTFITLADIPGNEIIYLGEEGWNNTGAGSWAGTSELHVAFTTPAGGLPCGTIVNLQETSTADDIEINSPISGSTVTFASGMNWNLSAGDQILAYQAATAEPATTPTFIAAIHGDDGNGTPTALDLVTGWNDASVGPLGVARSGLPSGLTNGVDCISLFPALGTEEDNAKYTGTLTGTSTVIRASINDRTNWSSDNSTPFDIGPSAYAVPDINCIVAPVELSYFRALINNEKVLLTWETASEFNNEKFIIESSSDGVDFKAIGEIQGYGTTLSTSQYHFTIETPSYGNNFYRLKQMDYDGEYEYSPVRTVEIKNARYKYIEVYPNPASQEINIRANDKSNLNEIKIYTVTGQRISNGISIQQITDSEFKIDISTLDSGIYIIQTKFNKQLVNIVN